MSPRNPLHVISTLTAATLLLPPSISEMFVDWINAAFNTTVKDRRTRRVRCIVSIITENVWHSWWSLNPWASEYESCALITELIPGRTRMFVIQNDRPTDRPTERTKRQTHKHVHVILKFLYCTNNHTLQLLFLTDAKSGYYCKRNIYYKSTSRRQLVS